jgi:hypothetical protein
VNSLSRRLVQKDPVRSADSGNFYEYAYRAKYQILDQTNNPLEMNFELFEDVHLAHTNIDDLTLQFGHGKTTSPGIITDLLILGRSILFPHS